MVTAADVIAELQSLANPANTAGMARYGINTASSFGISIYTLRDITKRLGTDHQLALDLWQSGLHDARNLASMVADPLQLTEEQMERWVIDFDSWDVCDQVTSNLFDKSPFAYH
jgi:3-methyladenine DNA glycosylase AlkD